MLTADDAQGNIAAATVNWVTQSAFAPPLVVVGMKARSRHLSDREGGKDVRVEHAAKDQKGLAFTFFRPADVRKASSPASRSTRARRVRRS